MIMENIYSKDNYNISYKRFCATKTKRRPGRPPASINEPPVNCFVCDEKITKQKVNLLHGASNNKDGFACQISQLLGDEFLIIVQEDDYLCKHCVLLLNNMDKFEKQLADVKEKLCTYLNSKYDLNNKPSSGNTTTTTTSTTSTHHDDVKFVKTELIEEKSEDCEDYHLVKRTSDSCGGGSIGKSKALQCNVCNFSTSNQNELDQHLRDHISNAIETEFSENSRSSSFSDNTYVTSSAIKLYKCSICLKVYLSKSKCVEHMKLYHVPVKTTENSEDVFNSLIESRKNDKRADDNLFYCKSCRLSFTGNDEFCKHSCGFAEKLYDESSSSSMKYITDTDENSKTNCNVNTVDKFFSSKDKPVDSLNFQSLNDTGPIKESNSTVGKICDDNGIFMQRNDENEATSKMCDNNNMKIVSKDDLIGRQNCADADDDNRDAEDVNISGDDSYSDEANSDDSDEEEDSVCFDKQEKHTCGNCGFKGDLASLKEHFLEERLQRDLICSVCGQSFNSFCKLIRHSSGHDMNSKPVECIYCPNEMRVPDMLSLTYHMKKVHLESVDEKWCSECDKVFPNSAYLHKHRMDKLCFNGKDDEESMDTCQDNSENSSDVGAVENIIIKEECSLNCEDIDSKAEPSIEKTDKRTGNGFNLSDKSNKNLDESKSDFTESTNSKSGFIDRTSIYNPSKMSGDVMDTTVNTCGAKVDKTLSVVYKCGVCGEQRNTKDELLKHFESHNTSGNSDINNEEAMKLFCNICGIKFSKESISKQHERKHSDSSQNIFCLYCKNNFHDNVHLKHHIIRSHSYNINNLFCSLCDLKFNNAIDFRNHLFRIHRSGNYFCKKCNKNFNFKYKLLKHYCTYHKSEFKCKFCSAVLKNLSDNVKHERSHSHDSRDLKCSFCGRLFKNIHSLKSHNARHGCDFNLFCMKCELSFDDANALNDHMHLTHKGDTDLYSCDKCGKRFMYYNRYRIHRLNHKNERFPYECKSCRAKFNNLTLRAIHKRRLHKATCSIYRCNFCNKFTTNNLFIYKKHLLLHIKKYEYHCKTCLKFYTNPNRLIAHKYRIHSSSRSYRSFCKLNSKESTINCNRLYDDHLHDRSTSEDKTLS